MGIIVPAGIPSGRARSSFKYSFENSIPPGRASPSFKFFYGKQQECQGFNNILVLSDPLELQPFKVLTVILFDIVFHPLDRPVDRLQSQSIEDWIRHFPSASRNLSKSAV
jgi:hypothetical protein